jgi:hypothetical protein
MKGAGRVADDHTFEEETRTDDALKDVLALDEAGVGDLVAVYEAIEQRYFAAVAAEVQPAPPAVYSTHT